MRAMSPPPATPSARDSAVSFFRQSGWMLVATFLSGLFFWAVHSFASKMPEAEYGLFCTLLTVINQMAIPTIGLQTVFVQEAALAESEEHRRQLAGATRSVLLLALVVWLLGAALVFLCRHQIQRDYGITNPAALWMTVAAALLALCLPVLNGILQGRQNFLWLGMSSIATAFGRVSMVAMIVLVFGGYAAGGMLGVLLGSAVGIGIGVWQTHHLWRRPAARFCWGPWLKRVVPLTLGLGAMGWIQSFDMIVVRRFQLESGTGLYGAAGMIGRALMFMVGPMTLVMFPKIVRSAAKAERTDVLAQVLGATALLAGSAALFATFFAKWPLLLVQGPGYLPAAPLVPWFTWAILPLTIANVLVNNLLARQQYAAVPWLTLVAAAYTAVLWFGPVHHSQLGVIRTMGVFALLFFLVCCWFTWGKAFGQRRRGETPAGAAAMD